MKKNETYSLPEELIKAVREYAANNTGNKSIVVELAIKDYLEKKEKEGITN